MSASHETSPRRTYWIDDRLVPSPMRFLYLPHLGFNGRRVFRKDISKHRVSELIASMCPPTAQSIKGKGLLFALIRLKEVQVIQILFAASGGIGETALGTQNHFKILKGPSLTRFPKLMKTAPRVLPQFIDLNGTRADRIEVNVVDHRREGSTVNEDRLVPSLENMSLNLPEPIEAVGEGALQPTHALNEIPVRCVSNAR